MTSKTERVVVTWPKPHFSTGGFTAGIPPVVYTVEKRYLGMSVRGGPSVPGYRQLIASRSSATSEISKTMYAGEAQQAFCLSACKALSLSGGIPKTVGYVSASLAPSMWPTILMPAAPGSQQLTDLRSLASAKFRKKCEDRIASFGGMQFLGELPETLQFLSKGGHTVLKQSVSLVRRMKREAVKQKRRKRGNWKERFLAKAEDIYLSYTYAVKPLLGDIENGLETLRQLKDRAVPSMDVRAVTRRTYGDGYAQSYSLGCLHTQKALAVSIVAVRGCLSASILWPEGTDERALQAIQMDARGVIGNFVPTIYELIPHSFILDYVSNLGSVIQAEFGAQPKLDWCSTSTFTKRERERIVSVKVNPRVAPPPTLQLLPDWIDVKADGFARERIIHWSRTSAIPGVQLQLLVPKPLQAFNMSALARAYSGLMSILG